MRDRWAPGFCDHAALLGSLSAPAAMTGRRCTPGAIALLPPEATADLQLAFTALHHAIGVPFAIPDDTTVPPPPAAPSDPVWPDPPPLPGFGPEWNPADQVPANAALAVYGRDVMATTIRSWCAKTPSPSLSNSWPRPRAPSRQPSLPGSPA